MSVEHHTGTGAAARPRPRGRPRDAERHRATIAATVALLREVGYDRLSIAEVARRAGVGRQLIYQWWGTKAMLVQEALFERDPRAPRTYPGPFTTDVRLLIEEMVDHFSRPEMRRGLPGLTTEMTTNRSLRRAAETKYVEPLQARYARVVEAAIERGDVRPETSPADLLDTLRGAVTFHLQLRPTRPRPELVGHLVDLVVHGVQR
ncbi:MAG TPA: TetR/AcrR family transcriptional regulator [Acidimicrobiia bacterium]